MAKNKKNKKKIERLLDQIDQQTAAGNMETVNKLIDIIDRMTKNGTETETPINEKGRYVYARVLTLADGTKHYHPLIGMLRPSGNREDYKMESYEDIVDLQDSAIGQMVRCISKEYNMRIIFVPSKVYAELERKLKELIDGVFDHLGNAANEISAAAALLGIQQGADEALEEQAQILFDRPIISGAGVTRDMTVVNRADYIDEEVDEDESCEGCVFDEKAEDEDESCEGCPCADCLYSCGSSKCENCEERNDHYCV